jgi:hypothetical protein
VWELAVSAVGFHYSLLLGLLDGEGELNLRFGDPCLSSAQ